MIVPQKYSFKKAGPYGKVVSWRCMYGNLHIRVERFHDGISGKRMFPSVIFYSFVAQHFQVLTGPILYRATKPYSIKLSVLDSRSSWSATRARKSFPA